MNVEALYQDIILDHYKHPRGRGLLAEASGESHQVNPTCGDEVTVQVSLGPEGGLVVGYEGQGCSISQASASVMSELVTGVPAARADAIRAEFLELMRGKGAVEPDEDVLGDAVAFAGVAKYPARIKCALLPWTALQDAQARAGIIADTQPDEGSMSTQEEGRS
ncbi:MAG: SUF system NifU family Fe-S cluster assembly protein [Actinomycetota bacterium]|nr:SUF system NifU family Fe-S cluster assembly protein [Actinomycetota bacterium]